MLATMGVALEAAGLPYLTPRRVAGWPSGSRRSAASARRATPRVLLLSSQTHAAAINLQCARFVLIKC